MSKRIIIKESSLYKMREQLNEEASSTNLPRFLFDDVKEHNTSLGDSKVFPNFGHYPYDYKITKMRYLEVKETIEKLVGEKNPDINTLLSDVSKLTQKAIEIEKPIRDNLVKLCENVVARLFLIPEDTIVLDLNLVDKLEPKHPFLIQPEDGEYKFKSSEDAENAANAIEKRRVIDALIQGAATEFSKNIAYYSEELDEINGELGELYEKIIAINNYLLFVKKEKIKDDKPMQGGFVEVELGTSEEKTTITAQGLIFPYLLHETVRGLFELFASKGLPQDNGMAKYVIQNADFVLAEPWDLRLGCTMWSTITNNIEDTKIIPFFFSELCQLPMEEFNKKVMEILGCTEEGDEYSKELIDVAKEQFEMSDFEHMVAKKNSEEGLISDEYISSDELDNYIIDDPNDSFKETLEEDDVNEYSTPDKIDTSDYKFGYKDGGIPFIVMNDRDKTVFFGDEEQTHNEMKIEIIAFEVDTTESIVKSIVNDEFYPVYDENDEPIDDYYTNDCDEEFDDYTISCVKEYYDDATLLNKCAYLFGRMWPWAGDDSETFMSIWLNGRFWSEDDYEEYYSNIDGDNEDGVEMNISDYDEFGDEVYEGSRLPKRLSRDVIEALIKVAKEYGIDDLENTYLCIGDTNITLFDLYYGKENVEVSQEDERESENQRNIHLMNQQDKRNALQNFRQNKNAIWQQKYNQTPSKTGAEWHNMMYQEGVIRESVGDEHKISFRPQEIENNCYQMHVLIDDEEVPVEYINFYVNPREIQGQTLYQPHIFIAPELQRHGFAFAIYKQFIREYGNLYSGRLRCMNPTAINPLYEKLGMESDINVGNVTDADGNVIGTLAWLV